MKKSGKQKFELNISGVTENLEVIRNFIRDLSQKAGFGKEEEDEIVLAVDEACTNAIKHAYQYDGRRKITIKTVIFNEGIEIVITDKGQGFDIEKLPKPDLEAYAHKAKKGGLGIHLMRTLMDEVKYDFKPGKKNSVTLVKMLS
jgi:serine/threonine-protein kinase RsbW